MKSTLLYSIYRQGKNSKRIRDQFLNVCLLKEYNLILSLLLYSKSYLYFDIFIKICSV